MKKRLFSPGPTPVPERVLLSMAEPLFHHRDPAFEEVFREVREGLKYVFQTEKDVLILASSGTGAMEAAVVNTLCQGDAVLVVRGGKFGERWAEICEAYGLRVVPVDAVWGEAIDPVLVQRSLEADPEIRAVMVQACETSTGVLHPVKELCEIVREREDTIIIVDAISALGAVDLPMDRWGIDVMVAGSQKALMLPPGLSFVALSEKAWRFVKRSTLPKYYFDLEAELRSQRKNQTHFTPAISLVVGLREALRMIKEEGLQNIFERHKLLARAVQEAVRAMGLELLADSPSPTLTAIKLPSGIDGQELKRRLEDRYGLIVAGGQEHLKGKIIRIAHMGYFEPSDILQVVAALELELKGMGYPVELGRGVSAAQKVFEEADL